MSRAACRTPARSSTAELAEIARKAVLDHPQDCLGYGPTSGLPELREAIAARHSRGGLKLGPENVLLTASGTQALDLVGKVLIEPGRPRRRTISDLCRRARCVAAALSVLSPPRPDAAGV